MAIKMLKMRIRGVEIPKRSLNDRFNQARAGTLEIKDTTDQGLHRMARIARFKHAASVAGMDVLYDPVILWWSGGRFVLAGFERLKNDQLETVDFAQSWLCFDGDPPAVSSWFPAATWHTR